MFTELKKNQEFEIRYYNFEKQRLNKLIHGSFKYNKDIDDLSEYDLETLDKYMKVSDKFTCYICNECNMSCVNIPCNSDYYCKNCNNYLNFTKINIPYSCKLLFQELQSMSIVPRYIV